VSTHDQIMNLEARMERPIIGQEQVVERLLQALLFNGNVLVERLPGLATTREVKSLAKTWRRSPRPLATSTVRHTPGANQAPAGNSIGTGVTEESWMTRPLEFQPLGERGLLLVSR